MEDTQSFRLIGTTEIVRIPIQHIDGQTVVYWESIEKVFPEVKCVKHGGVTIPRFIKYLPGAVLDIALSNASDKVHVNSLVGVSRMVSSVALNPTQTVDQTDAPADPPTDPPSEEMFVEGLRVTSTVGKTPISNIGTRSSTGSSILPPSLLSKVKTTSKTTMSFLEVVKLASKKANESGGQVQQQELSTQMAYMIKLQETSDAKQEEMSQLQKQALIRQERMEQLQEELNQLQKVSDVKQEKMNQLQKQALDQQKEMKQLALDHHREIKQLQIHALGQLCVLQSRVQAVLTQTYELHEYPIPRLFVVLPQDPSVWDAVNPFSNTFRLYFLCECGEHTKSTSSKTEIPHDIHFAKHEGYEIVRPSEFFQQYGPYILTILKMLKFGVSVAGVVVPAIAHLVRSDAVDQATAGLQQLRDNIEPGMDHVIDWMEKVSVNEGEAVDEFAEQIEKKEALEGADLRKLDTFLKDKDGNNVLGNLYRTVTDEGHVKWVCIDHYRMNYLENSAKAFLRVLDSVGGSFIENVGRVDVRLQSRALSEHFFSALGKARSVYELNIGLHWACTSSDLEALKEALKTSRVSILRLDLQQYRTSLASKLLPTSTQYDVIFRIRDLPNMKVLHIVVAKELIKFLGFPPKKSTHACKMSYELASGRIGGKEFGLLAEALKTNSTLTTLNLENNLIGFDGAKALAEALKTNKALTTLNLRLNSIGSYGAMALAEALKTNKTLTTLNLVGNSIGSDGAKALAEALKTSKNLTTLNLESNSIGDDGAKALATAFKINSTLTTLNLERNSVGDDGAKALTDALKTNSTLTTLNLENNSIGDDGAMALAEALKTNKTLTTLNLRLNSIGSYGAMALAEALKTNKTLTTLNMVGNSIGSNGAMALAEALMTNSTLTTLNLESNSIGDDGAKALAKAFKINSTLTTLNLRHSSIRDNGAKALADALKTSKNLTTLNLESNSIEDDGAKALATAFKINSTLTTLNLERNSIGDDGTKALAEAFKTNSTLTTLNLMGNSIRSSGAMALAEVLKTNSTLITLNLRLNSIGSYGAMALAEALMTNKTLTTLNLMGNSIGDDGAKALAEALKTNKTLTTLNLMSNSIGDNGAKALAEALKTNKTLTTLNLTASMFGSKIGSDGAKALAEALMTNKTLTTLNMMSNSIGDNGAKALAEALRTNSMVAIDIFKDPLFFFLERQSFNPKTEV
ncbi:hypothetical protein F5H01DRAFT_394807 [Linnemannia elongata]|nr:hypothetical protein F5H01DRAFT_394807 [Linnemannia elongata]